MVPDPAGGFALPMERGRVRMVPPGAVGEIYPGVAAPAVPSIVGMTVATADRCAALQPFLDGVAQRQTAAGILIEPKDAGGAALLFT